MTKGTYVRLSENMTVAELKNRLGSQLKPVDPTADSFCRSSFSI